MAGIFIEVVAFIADTILGIIQILPLIDGGSNPTGSVVRVGVGMYDNKAILGGNVPGITVWGEDGKYLGKVGPSSKQVEAGSYTDIVVPQHPASQQPTYVRVEGGSDSICVAYIGHAWPDGTKRGWLGDMGKKCGKKYYYSDVYVTQANGTQYKPMCTWIGGTGSMTDWVTQMTIHTPHFSSLGDANDFSVPADPSSLCRHPATTWSNDPVFTSGSLRRASLFSILSPLSTLGSIMVTAIPANLNSISKTASSFQDVIVGSHDARHNSTALCSNPSSYGPDFVSFHESVFCDMRTRQTWTLCSTTRKDDCYDWHTHTLIDRKLKKRRLDKNKIIEWR